jgi:hypothetical protein
MHVIACNYMLKHLTSSSMKLHPRERECERARERESERASERGGVGWGGVARGTEGMEGQREGWKDGRGE